LDYPHLLFRISVFSLHQFHRHIAFSGVNLS
jgi:hypothetical protein